MAAKFGIYLERHWGILKINEEHFHLHGFEDSEL